MNPAVLMLTSVFDFSADKVAIRLKEAGVPYLRINREHVSDYRFSLNPKRPLLSVESRVEGDDGRWCLDSSLRSVWFRQPAFLRNCPPYPLAIAEQLSRSQWSAFFRALSVFNASAWMNWPQATYLAESKPYQLFLAHRCGLKTPETIVGNSVLNLKRGRAVVKSLDTALLREGSDSLFTYSTYTDLPSEEESQSSPFVIQEYISGKVDVRVTIIGEALSAVRILSNGEPVGGDWRTFPKDSLKYVDATLPEPIAGACKELTRRLGLAFAAIDLLERDGDYYFIEVNPTGEWGWLNCPTRPFDRLIAEWLADPGELRKRTIRGGGDVHAIQEV